jgi:hypothetical protein
MDSRVLAILIGAVAALLIGGVYFVWARKLGK